LQVVVVLVQVEIMVVPMAVLGGLHYQLHLLEAQDKAHFTMQAITRMVVEAQAEALDY
jgi:hypothetical protein